MGFCRLAKLFALATALGFYFLFPIHIVIPDVRAEVKADNDVGVAADGETGQQGLVPSQDESFSKVTIVVALTPTQADGSAWDVSAGADIVLCGAKGCYVSEGFTKPAKFYEGSSGLRLLKKAGTCRDQLKCVFRGVQLEKLVSKDEPGLQIADVDYVSHTYLEKFEADAGFDCAARKVVVTCNTGIHRRTFSLWVMKEEVADKAGKAGLDYVLFKGLASQRVEALADRLVDVRTQVKTSVGRFFNLVLGDDVPVGCLQKTEVLTESFYLAGLADANQRRAEFLIKDFVGGKSLLELRPIVQQNPQLYWAFLDIVQQLHQFSLAKKSQLDEAITGLSLVDGGEEGPILHYGWQVKSRAQALLESCVGAGRADAE